MFYSFISSWQAQNLRSQIARLLDNIDAQDMKTDISYWRFNEPDSTTAKDIVNIEGTEIPLLELPKEGVLDISENVSDSDSLCSGEYILFYKSTIDSMGYIYFVKIDTNFMQAISKNIQVLAGSSIHAHTIMPSKWSSYIYELDFMQRKRLFRFFPLGSTPIRIRSRICADLTSKSNEMNEFKDQIDEIIKQRRQLSFGRVFIPMIGLDRITDRYFAIDILLSIDSELIWSGLPQVFIILFLIYLLINTFVIQRVITFGSHINKMIVNKFIQLKSGIRQISSGNLDYKIKLGGEDEFVELADHFNEMGEKLKEKIAEAREKDRLQYELQLAREVQLDLLPVKLPRIDHYIISASLKTANEVGGDLYDIFSIGNGKYLFSIGDVSGKGSSAAFYMAQFISLLRFSRQFTEEPEDIASRLNDYFATNIKDSQIFVTAIVGLLDTKRNRIRLIRAGHTEPLLIPGDGEADIRNIKVDGVGIGLTGESKTFDKLVKNVEFVMNVGDVLFMCTDGIIEANKVSEADTENEEFMMYGEGRLQEFLQANRTKSPAELIRLLENEIDEFYDGIARVDDQTVFIIKRTS